MSVEVYKLTDSVYEIRVVDRSTRFFEGYWEIPEGVTYNSYVITTPEGAVVLDTVKAQYALEYLEALRRVVDPRDVRLIVVHHSEPDHSGAFPILYREAGSPEVLAHPIARRILESRYGVRIERFRAAGDGAVVELGGGARLRVFQVPWLHWPDTIVTLYEPDRIAFTGDVFGSYGSPASNTDRGLDWGWYERLMVKYFVTVIGTYRDWVKRNLGKLEKLVTEARMVAPLHGVVLVERRGEALELYRRLASGSQSKRALVVYATMYGAAEAAAITAAGLLAEKGWSVAVHGSSDSRRMVYSEMLTDAILSRLIVLVAPVYEAAVHPEVEHIVGLLCKKAAAGQAVVLLSSYGWGPTASKLLKPKLEACGLRVVAVAEAQGRLPEEKVREAVEKALEAL